MPAQTADWHSLACTHFEHITMHMKTAFPKAKPNAVKALTAYLKRLAKALLLTIAYSLLLASLALTASFIAEGIRLNDPKPACAAIVPFLFAAMLIPLLRLLHKWNPDPNGYSTKPRSSRPASCKPNSWKTRPLPSEHSSETDENTADGIISTFYNTLCESTNGGKKQCNGDCENCPPHYGYRYGRWYYGHHHNRGCEFGGNKGL